MNNSRLDSQPSSIAPPGVSSDYLIEPTYVRTLNWGFYCIRDRLTLRQIGILIGAERGLSGNVYGSFISNGSRKIVALDGDPKAISAYFAEMVGGDVCVYDLPNSFPYMCSGGRHNHICRCKRKSLKMRWVKRDGSRSMGRDLLRFKKRYRR
jgi:hypothetical protein